MEPFSATASGIALVQGVAMVGKVIKALSDSSEIQQEFEALGKELQFLRMAAEMASNAGAMTPMLWAAVSSLQHVVTDVEQMQAKLTRHSDDVRGIERAKTIKMILKEGTVGKLAKKVADVKHTMNLALGLEQRVVAQSSLDRLMALDHTVAGIWMRLEALEPKKVLVEDESTTGHGQSLMERDSTTDDAESLAGEAETLRIESVTSDDVQSVTETTARTRTVFGPVVNDRDEEPLSIVASSLRMGIEPMTESGCSRRCGCRCHFIRTAYAMPKFAESIFGGLSIQIREGECSVKGGCNARKRGRVKLGLQPPTWLMSTASSINYSLRAPRVLAGNDRIWFIMETPLETIHGYFENTRFGYFPDDGEDGRHRGLVEYALQKRACGFLEFLLDVLWKDLLVRQRLPRRVFFVASHMMENWKLNEREMVLAKRAQSYVEDVDELRRTKLHWAVIDGQMDEIEEALKEGPWALDKLDHAGRAPIHWAVRGEKIAGLGMLVGAGADVNQRDWKGLTALMLAAIRDSGVCVQWLLQHQARVNAQDTNGWTALHHAVGLASPGIVSALLRHGASPRARNARGETPLHTLAWSKKPAATMAETLRLILAHPEKSDLEATDGLFGHTPSLRALMCNNLPALQSLVEAGASLRALIKNSSSILHLAALYADTHTLQFLIDQPDQHLQGIDHQLHNADNNAPWDLFQWARRAQPWQLGANRKPSPEEEQLFTRLYCKVRNLNIQSNIASFTSVRNGIASKDTTAALCALHPLSKQSEELARDNLMSHCRDIQKHVNREQWDQAADVVDEAIRELQYEMESDPWDQDWTSDSDEDDDADDQDETDN